MHALIWALLERVAPRLGPLILLVLAAGVVSPSAFGYYSWAALLLTLFQSFGESAVRQYSVMAVGSDRGLARVRMLQLVTGVVGTGFMTLVVLGIVAASGATWLLLAQLSPLIVAPAISAAGVERVAALQRARRWRSLAAAQLWGAAISAPVSVILVLLGDGSLLGFAVQFPLAELIFLLIVLRSSGGIRSTPSATSALSDRGLGALSAYALIGWLQGQLDRLLVGAFVGTAGLAQYSSGMSFGRSGGEAVAASTANVVRAELSADGEQEHSWTTSRRLVLRGMAFAAILSVAVPVALFAISGFVSSEWSDSFVFGAVVSVSAIPGVAVWCSSAMLQKCGSVRRALPVRIVAIFLSVPIALIARADLVSAGWFFVGREVLVMTASFILVGRAFGLKMYLASMGMISLSSVFAVLFVSWVWGG